MSDWGRIKNTWRLLLLSGMCCLMLFGLSEKVALGLILPRPGSVTGNSAPGSKTPQNDSSSNQPPVRRTLLAVRHWSSAEVTNAAIDLDGAVKYKVGYLHAPERLYFDISDVQLEPAVLLKKFSGQDGFLRNVRVAHSENGATRIVFDLSRPVSYSVELIPDPYRLQVTLRSPESKQVSSKSNSASPAKRKKDSATARSSNEPALAERNKAIVTAAVAVGDVNPREEAIAVHSKPGRPVAPSAILAGSGMMPATQRTFIRALGLKIGKIVIDPGHGGDDVGGIGPSGVLEKDLVLDVAMRLGKLLRNLGAEVSYTRVTDVYLPLEARTQRANREQADLFVSIHANSSPDHSAHGIETYYLNFTSSPAALEVAARENMVSQRSVNQLRDLVQKIAMAGRLEESRELATDVEKNLAKELPNAHNRGVKEAPFIVLTGANMPAILTEISFLSNPDDERELKDPAYRQKIAQALYSGVSDYVAGLGGISPVRHTQSAAASSVAVDFGPTSWSDTLLDFVASNRTFVSIALLLIAAWTFLLASPTRAQPAPETAVANSAVLDKDTDGEQNEPDYAEAAPKLRIVHRS
jgi:N-acetylmuramoyl-L-alanine amidase